MIEKAIKKINVNAEYTINADDINTIEWLNGTTPIPVADIEAKMVEVHAEYDAKPVSYTHLTLPTKRIV